MDILNEDDVADYEWEDAPRCSRCGTTDYLLCDTETRVVLCTRCSKTLHEHQPRPLQPVEGVEDLDFYL
jgi:hypothetical protein